MAQAIRVTRTALQFFRLSDVSFHAISSLEVSLFLKAKPELEELEVHARYTLNAYAIPATSPHSLITTVQIGQDTLAKGPTQNRAKVMPDRHLSRLRKLVLRQTCSLASLRHILAAASGLEELHIKTSEKSADDW